jgi:Barrel-sandwich domain of CusB or HlyD membrane-fusion
MPEQRSEAPAAIGTRPPAARGPAAPPPHRNGGTTTTTRPPGDAAPAPPPVETAPAPPAEATPAPSVEDAPAPAADTTPASPADSAPVPAAPDEAPRRRRRLSLLVLPVLALVGLVGLVIGYKFWYESSFFLITDNAAVAGDLVQVGSLNAGRLVAAPLEVGRPVERDAVIAEVAVPQQVGAVPFSDTPLLDQTGSANARIPVRSPLSGVVAARLANVGGTVTAGQAIYALVDPLRVWVNANVDEAKVSRVQPGQPVEVHVDALNRSFPATVLAVTPASAATFSLLPAQNVSGNFTKVTQYVPVKVMVDSGDAVLPLGTSVEVRIQVGTPPGWLPWHP